MKITFNGSTVDAKDGVSIYDAAAEAGVIDRSVIAAEVNGELAALTTVPADNASVKLLTFDDEGGKHVFRSQNIGFNRFNGEKLARWYLLKRRSVKYVVNAVHSVLD